MFAAPIQGAECQLLIAAASDLTPLEQSLRHVVPNCSARFVFNASGALARQIIGGADYDVFLSASAAYVDRVGAAGAAVAESRRTYARGRLGFWSTKGVGWVDLSDKRVARIAIANPLYAPYGEAARQALQTQGLWAALSSKVVQAGSVRQALQYAETGNVDAALVSWSLVHRREAWLVPEEWHAPIVQVGVITTRSRNPLKAKEFLSYLTSPEGRATLKRFGFFPPK